ncbi:MAG TPA: aminotransferase class I/II-fold pyridoxal phosphate-dependent enzyme [Solirubrobacteraceae bacterium]|jgi:aspartate/methionine/tyrosine aminotransferase|nr:aminotransferase class I/II-fold pyridoxal phosphate-dependent enzyme [Solirubrobacteraceae bacterium]
MSRATFERVVELARERDVVLFCDEVYRELEHDAGARLPAACDIGERAVSLGSISKTYGLPGLRIGWLATRDPEIREVLVTLKDYTTICTSAPSELLVALALRHRHVVAQRNLEIVRRNLPLLDELFKRHASVFRWVRPTAAPIGFGRCRRRRAVRGARQCGGAATPGVGLRRAAPCPRRVRPRGHARGA